MVDVHSSQFLVRKKAAIFLMTLPLVFYGLITSVNNIFGIDFTGGFLGAREPVGAGLFVVFGAPVYFYYFSKSLLDLFQGSPVYLSVSSNGLQFYLPHSKLIRRVDIASINFSGSKNDPCISLILKHGGKKEIRLKNLAVDQNELLQLLKKFGFPIGAIPDDT